jgi:hypothetical protein
MEQQKRNLYRAMSEEVVSWSETFEQLFNKDVQTTKNLETPSIILKQAQKFNKKRGKRREIK